MISISQKRIKTAFSILICVSVMQAVLPFPAFAQSERGLSLSVTPTLFQMAASPSQKWDSTVKVINNNSFEITVYANVVNFAPQGETGEGKFIPVVKEVTEGSTLAEWITVPQEAIIIPPQQSYSIPVTVHVPDDATPGGHFAAILVGTRPQDKSESFQVRTSQLVTSLFFVRIAGDVDETGSIREFRTVEKFVDSPRADFEVRFENKGNVHLQPQGEIVITNMWGKERGIIPINHKTHFGNVLPQSIRKFDFSWKGESSISDIGRYRAALTLGYGEEEKNFVTSYAYFYVVPFKALAIVLGSLLLIGLALSWMIKAYIRRMLLLAGVEPGSYQKERQSFAREGDVRVVKRVSIKAPVQSGVSDLKERLAKTQAFTERIQTIISFVVAYKFFFIGVAVLIAAGAAVWLFVSEVSQEQKDYEVVIDNVDTDVTLSSEEIIYDRTQTEEPVQQSQEKSEQRFELVLVNSSDTPGAAGSLQRTLEAEGYAVSDLQSDFEETKERTVIVYDVEAQEEALTLSKKMSNALLSSNPSSSSTTPSIRIYIGNDYTVE
jgi:hypothetical protein